MFCCMNKLHFIRVSNLSIYIGGRKFRSKKPERANKVSIPHQRWGLYDCWPLEGALPQSAKSKSKPETTTSRHTPGTVERWESPT
jgi:hypothetical protein